ncbi:MAG: DNA repair protein RecN [Burkholderiales bacterium]|nr:DNA repair protein RecN [Burkholderiales bacterium]
MSLLHIALKDFVIVKSLALDLESGFTALTGETGAGKSILVDALQFALGSRADAGLIRTGQAKAEVSAEFHATPDVTRWLDEQELLADGPTVLIRRSVDRQARGRGWINGTSATAAQLRELGGLLLDIHGQHAWQALMKPETTRALLDGYGQIDTTPLQPLWRDWKAAQKALADAQTGTAHHEHTRERLAWQIAELEKLAPGTHEWAELQAEHTRLANVHGLMESAQTAADSLLDADVNAVRLLTKAAQALAGRAHIEPQFAAWGQMLEQASVLMEDTAHDLHSYIRRLEADPTRLLELDQRLGSWLALAKRHQCEPAELPALMLAYRQQLADLQANTDLTTLTQRVHHCEAAFIAKSKEISDLRHIARVKLATEITARMQQLGMTGGQFEVQLNALDSPQSFGLESIEFLVAGHAGVAPRPVAKVASGGELSRISLAIAVTTSQLGGCPTLIFDEVDSGVGGAVAHTVGQLMAQLGNARQVLAVTHLPQVAARAHHHLKVSKADKGDGVTSDVTTLQLADRVHEIARMLGGATITETTLAHAQEMLSS